MAGLPTNISEAVRRRNPNLFKTPQCVKEHPAPPLSSDVPACLEVRPSSDEMHLNKTEREYLMFIRHLGFAWIGVQNITLKLGDDLRLTMDFAIVEKSGTLRLVDTKACNRKTGKPLVKDDALVKMKCGARMFPFIRFQMAYCHDGTWRHVDIKP